MVSYFDGKTYHANLTNSEAVLNFYQHSLEEVVKIHALELEKNRIAKQNFVETLETP